MKHHPAGRAGNLLMSCMCWIAVPVLLVPFILSALNWLCLGPSLVEIKPLAWLALPLVALLLGLTGLYFYGQARSYLVTGPQGIEKHGVGYFYATGWNNIAGIGLLGRSLPAADPHVAERVEAMQAQVRQEIEQSSGGKRLFYKAAQRVTQADTGGDGFGLDGVPEGLVLYRPVAIEKQTWAWGILNQTRFFDLSDYPHWRHTALGQEIARYAPQALKKV